MVNSAHNEPTTNRSKEVKEIGVRELDPKTVAQSLRLNTETLNKTIADLCDAQHITQETLQLEVSI